MSAKAMRKMGSKIDKMLPNDFGYALLVFPYHKPGVSNYISSANRSDMIKVLRETADRLEKNQDFQTPEDNIYT